MKTANRLNRDRKVFLGEVEKLWPVAEGSLSEVRKPCIRPNCSACGQGRKHKAFIFSYNEKGPRRCMYVLRDLVPLLRQAIRNGRKLAQCISRAVGLSAGVSLFVCCMLFQSATADDVPPRAKKRAGVTLLKRNKCDTSYRLYSSRGSEAAHIIDLDGRQVHGWSYPQGHTWHYAEILPNGHLVAIIKDLMILELDWDSKLVWKAKLRAHHDFARLSNGNTLVVSRRPLTNPWTKSGRLKCDILVELTPENEVVWEWKVEEHAKEIAEHVPLKIPPSSLFSDWPHINTIEVLPDGPTAKWDSRFKPGNLLFCGRHIDTIGVIERRTGKVVWAWGPGELLGPHMPTMLPNGHLLIYDNGSNKSTHVRGYTRIVELNPISGKIVWEYKAEPPNHFYSQARGSSVRLANGNTLIAESDPGRFFEVTPEGRTVWEFYNPDLNKNGSRMALYRTLSYRREFIDQLAAKAKDSM